MIYNFHPKAILSWVGRVIDVNTDDMLNKIIKLCMIKGQNNLHIIVMFDDQPPYNYTDRHVLTRLLAFSDELTVGRDVIEQSVDDAKVKGL